MDPDQQARVDEARKILAALNFDSERCNERSALVLLALLELTPTTPWDEAESPMLRTVEIMEWIGTTYSVSYKPNTRETIRRQTLHQFVDAGLVALNPDDPERAINSPKNCYQVTPRALEVLQSAGNADWDELLEAYLKDLPGLQAQYQHARDLNQIPIVLPSGEAVTLTPGGQNVLIKQMLEEFCPRFTPGGQVLYIGDTGKDDPVFEEDALSRLGVALDKHGKFPDLIVYMPDKGWLVLLEAASSHGPVDAKRYGELHNLFDVADAGIVLVSCFPSRADMRKYLAEIAWETDVWCADNFDHLIHFNGERFLGPYE
jgi:hypothetical protein